MASRIALQICSSSIKKVNIYIRWSLGAIISVSAIYSRLVLSDYILEMAFLSLRGILKISPNHPGRSSESLIQNWILRTSLIKLFLLRSTLRFVCCLLELTTASCSEMVKKNRFSRFCHHPKKTSRCVLSLSRPFYPATTRSRMILMDFVSNVGFCLLLCVVAWVLLCAHTHRIHPNTCESEMEINSRMDIHAHQWDGKFMGEFGLMVCVGL